MVHGRQALAARLEEVELMNTMSGDLVITHEAPVWRERADFIIRAKIEGLEPAGVPKWEQLWTHQLDRNRYEICCIPFFIYNVALGDVVSIQRLPDDHVLKAIVKRSGRYVFRAWFVDETIKDDVAQQLEHSMNCLLEQRWGNSKLLAIDVVTGAGAQKVADFLHELQQQQKLYYETGLQ
jgi:hypothetical protein